MPEYAAEMGAGAKYCPYCSARFTGGRKQKVNRNGGLLWTIRSLQTVDLHHCDYSGFPAHSGRSSAHPDRTSAHFS